MPVWQVRDTRIPWSLALLYRRAYYLIIGIGKKEVHYLLRGQSAH
jgi:hypothetical protein